METKLTYQKLQDILLATEKINTEVKDKLSYWVGKLVSKLKDKSRDFSEQINEINIDWCSVDKDKDIKKDSSGNYIFTKENQKQRNIKVKELCNKEVEIDLSNCMCKDNSRVLTLPIHVIEELNGYLFSVSEQDFIEKEQK